MSIHKFQSYITEICIMEQQKVNKVCRGMTWDGAFQVFFYGN